MKKTLFRIYIINAVISGFFIIKGLWNIISVNIRSSHSDTLQKIASLELFSNFHEWINLIDDISVKVQSVMNIVSLYIYGYPSLLTGITALALSSMGTLFLTQKRTKATVGYYTTIILSYFILALLTLVYIIAGMPVF